MKTKNVVQLRDALLETFDGLRAGTIGNSEAKQVANVAGKVLSSAKNEMEYNKMVQSKSKIAFFESQ